MDPLAHQPLCRTEGHNPSQHLQCWHPSCNGAAKECLAEHWSTEATSTTVNISCCSWEKNSWKSAIIYSWEENSSLVWHCTVSEFQTPSPLGAKFPNADSNHQSQCPARQMFTMFSHLTSVWTLCLGVDTPKTQGPALPFSQKATWCTRVSLCISGPTPCSSCGVLRHSQIKWLCYTLWLLYKFFSGCFFWIWD